MKKFGRGMVISTAAVIIAAAALTGCGNVEDKAPASNFTETVKNVVAEDITKAAEGLGSKPAAKTEEAAETTEAPAEETEEQTAQQTEKKTAKTEKKKTKKAKKAAKTAKKETAKTENTEKKAAAETKAKTAEPETKKTEEKKAEPAKTAAETKKTEPAKQTVQPVIIPESYTPVWVEGDMYAGSYTEQNGSAVMEVTNIGNNWYSVHITRDRSSYETDTWDFIGQFDGRAAMNYTGCIKNYTVYYYDGSKGITTEYANGTGSIKFDDYGVVWFSGMGDLSYSTRFAAYKTNRNAAKENKQTRQEEAPRQEETKTPERPRVIVDLTTKENKETAPVQTESAYEAPAASGSNTGSSMGTSIQRPEKTAKTKDAFAGTFCDVNGSKATLEIRKAGKGYLCVVTAPYTDDSVSEWRFFAYAVNGKLVYNGGSYSIVTFGEEAGTELMPEAHNGVIRVTEEGLEWCDCDGSVFTFGTPDKVKTAPAPEAE